MRRAAGSFGKARRIQTHNLGKSRTPPRTQLTRVGSVNSRAQRGRSGVPARRPTHCDPRADQWWEDARLTKRVLSLGHRSAVIPLEPTCRDSVDITGLPSMAHDGHQATTQASTRSQTIAKVCLRVVVDSSSHGGSPRVIQSARWRMRAYGSILVVVVAGLFVWSNDVMAAAGR